MTPRLKIPHRPVPGRDVGVPVRLFISPEESAAIGWAGSYLGCGPHQFIREATVRLVQAAANDAALAGKSVPRNVQKFLNENLSQIQASFCDNENVNQP